ncbi:Golgi apparatus membrane protein TVP23, partial [Tolypocladium paradoxum]
VLRSRSCAPAQDRPSAGSSRLPTRPSRRQPSEHDDSFEAGRLRRRRRRRRQRRQRQRPPALPPSPAPARLSQRQAALSSTDGKQRRRSGETRRAGDMDAAQNAPGALSWRLSSHPITLLTFLGFRICAATASVLIYFLGLWVIKSMIMTFIVTILLLAADFYYLKNIAGRRLVGLRWWNEVDPQTGDSQWVFESSDPATKVVNATDSRFFWLALYVQPVLWVVMAVLAFVRLQFLWLPLVVIALVLTIMNTLAFSRCDKFSQASNLAGSALGTTNLAGSIASNMVGRWFSRN